MINDLNSLMKEVKNNMSLYNVYGDYSNYLRVNDNFNQLFKKMNLNIGKYINSMYIFKYELSDIQIYGDYIRLYYFYLTKLVYDNISTKYKRYIDITDNWLIQLEDDGECIIYYIGNVDKESINRLRLELTI